MASPSMLSAVKPSGSSVRSAKSITANSAMSPTVQQRCYGSALLRPACLFLASCRIADGYQTGPAERLRWVESSYSQAGR